jgi:hypothetical protein
MVRTRASESRRNNPPPEGNLNQVQVAAMEARIAQMSREMATLTEQNL